MRKMLVVMASILFIFSKAILLYAEEEVLLEGTVKPEDYQYNFEIVSENKEALLLLDKSVNSLRVVSKKTGNYYDTKVMNGQSGNEVIKNNQKSDFSLSYYTDLEKASTATVDNYSLSILLNQVEYESIDNGVRCNFIVGEREKIQLSLFPMYINKERFQQLVLQYLDDAQAKEMLDATNGYYIETKEKFIRRWNTFKKDGTPETVAMPKLKRMYHYFYEVGIYTNEELQIDNMEWGEETIDSNITFGISIDYKLEGTDLVVTVPVDKILIGSNYAEKHPINEITMNPYLMSGSIYDDGYIFVPDGSGGIIKFNSGNISASVLKMPIFGEDVLNNAFFYTESFVQSTLPVIGIKKNHISLLGIIEEGAEIATVTANVSGKVDEYNKVNVGFNLLYMEKMPLTIGFGNFMPKYSNSGYKGNITMRYKLLEGSEANYVGMAKAYRNYLKEKEAIKQNPITDDAPLFIDMIASVPKNKMMLGIKYTVHESVTSFSEAQSILESLKLKGINNIVAQYTSWANGGINNDPLTNIKVIRSIGGKNGLSKLLAYTNVESILFYPTIKLLAIGSTKGISNSNGLARHLNNVKAKLPRFNMVTKQTFTTESLISPNYLAIYISKIIKNTDKLNIKNLAITDVGTLLYGDYNPKKQLMRYDVLDIYEEGLYSLSQEKSLMFHNANSYVFKYASNITDLPSSYSGRRAIDYAVPFVQMVLENAVPYSMEAFNTRDLQDFNDYLLKAIETKSSLKFIFTHRDESIFYTDAGFYNTLTGENDYFRTQYSRWEDKIGLYYDEYNYFYRKVKDAEMVNHEVVRNGVVKVKYNNNIIIYINYTDKSEIVDGNKIGPHSYLLKE